MPVTSTVTGTFSLGGPVDLWLVEPYCTGSHQAWAEGYRAHSRHTVHLLTLPGRFWKWRMQGGALTLARRSLDLPDPDLILASDMLNLPVFLALSGERLAGVPVALYFHENQLTYPLAAGEKRDLNYGLINLLSSLRADVVFFNSAYHLEAFFAEVPRLLKHFPDYNELWVVEAVRARSRVLPLGLDLTRLDVYRPAPSPRGDAVVLWNHRWEYDKNPEAFLHALYALQEEGLAFRVILLGESFRNRPAEFLEARRLLADRILHFGYAEEFERYAALLWQADVVVSTALHEFFGAAVVEACYCDCFPLLPRSLSYPELIPSQFHAACLYDHWDGLLDRLRGAVRDPASVRACTLRPHMTRYDWGHLAPAYDDALEQVRRVPLPGYLPTASAPGHKGNWGSHRARL